jgi:hypothetical protein
MISKSVLDKAKAFLCWDTFSDLNVQFIELQQAVAYFFPPSKDRNTIVVFYRQGNPDFTKPFFLLFHEAGHYLQFQEWKSSGRETHFWKLIDTHEGSIKAAFEEESWNWGRDLIEDFIRKNELDESVLALYDEYASSCVGSYR